MHIIITLLIVTFHVKLHLFIATVASVPAQRPRDPASVDSVVNVDLGGAHRHPPVRIRPCIRMRNCPKD